MRPVWLCVECCLAADSQPHCAEDRCAALAHVGKNEADFADGMALIHVALVELFIYGKALMSNGALNPHA
jgi:hypothetical protein